MAENKSIYIKDIQDGQAVHDLFLIKEMSRAETRAGKPYLMLTVMDKSGEIAGRVWDDADRFMEICRAGQIVSVSSQAQSYKNILQLKINSLEPVDESSLDLALFLPSTPGDIEQMADEIFSLAKSVENEHLNDRLLSFFQSPAFFEAFKKAPAAKFMHHAYIGGLLEHTLGVTHLANMVCTLYPAIDRSMLLTGAILHDVGKVAEFSFDVFPFDYSDRGRLVGHMVLGIEMIQNRISTLENFPEEISTQLNHLILSHHGRYDFGSPVLPMTLEAFVLNFLDDMDSKVNYFGKLGEQAQGPDHQWTDYQRNMERFLFVRGDQPPTAINQAAGFSMPQVSTASSDANQACEVDPRQTSLWK